MGRHFGDLTKTKRDAVDFDFRDALPTKTVLVNRDGSLLVFQDALFPTWGVDPSQGSGICDDGPYGRDQKGTALESFPQSKTAGHSLLCPYPLRFVWTAPHVEYIDYDHAVDSHGQPIFRMSTHGLPGFRNQPGIPLKATGDGFFSRGYSNSFPAYRTVAKTQPALS